MLMMHPYLPHGIARWSRALTAALNATSGLGLLSPHVSPAPAIVAERMRAHLPLGLAIVTNHPGPRAVAIEVALT